MAAITRADCAALDQADPIGALRDRFELPEGVVYLDGNSLGPRPATAAARVAEVVAEEWGDGLIRSWNAAGWFALPRRLGDKLAPLIGAGPGEVVVTDTTSLNLFKVLAAALRVQRTRDPARTRHRLGKEQLPDRPIHRRGPGRPAATGPFAAPRRLAGADRRGDRRRRPPS